jgi:hypothetical protein
VLHAVSLVLFTTASRTALGPIQALIQWVPGSLSLGVKRPEREAIRLHLVPRSVRGATPPLPNTPSWRGVRFKKHRDNFTFTFTFR